jgi:hypothetical protein
MLNTYSSFFNRNIAFSIKECKDDNKHPSVSECATPQEIEKYINELAVLVI